MKLRNTLRSIRSKCVTCRKRKTVTLNPMMTDLLTERLAFGCLPFTNTGLDRSGPFNVSVKHATEKRWGLRFTCLITRVVYFEVVSSMDTSSCMMDIEKFYSRPGVLSVIWSDNKQTLVPVKRICWTTSPSGISKFWLKLWLKGVSSRNSTHRVCRTTELFRNDCWESSTKYSTP